MNTAVVSLGSNIDPEKNIAKVRQILSREQKILAESNFIVTKPVGLKDQPDFTNGAFLVSTRLNRQEFQMYLKSVETTLGRKHTGHRYDPRTIDLDIIVWNGAVVSRDFSERSFIKDSALQLLPNLTY